MIMRHVPAAAAFVALMGTHVPAAMATEASFRGTYTCDQLPTTRDVLRVPVRLIIDGDSARFTRPLLDLDGNRRGLAEVARGSIDRGGALRLQSRWSLLGNVARGDYRGTLTPAGGTLTGTQTWTGRGGAPVVRGCTVALVREAAADR